MDNKLLTLEMMKFPCFNGWPDKEYRTCIHYQVCGLHKIIKELYDNGPAKPLHIHVDCDKAEFPKLPRKKREKKVE